jgi:prevent-host-death family protein
MTSTEAQNGFGHLLETVAADRTVIITSRNAPRAVVMAVERYRELTGATEPDLDALTADFDAMLERMQSEESRSGVRHAFRASPDELGRASVAVARDKGR